MPIRIVKSIVSSIGLSSENVFSLFFSDEGPTLETVDFSIRNGSTPTYFDLFLHVVRYAIPGGQS